MLTIIPVYIRKPRLMPKEGSLVVVETRTIVFNVPEGSPFKQPDVFNHGYALDGHSAYKLVALEDLLREETKLQAWFYDLGYEARFE